MATKNINTEAIDDIDLSKNISEIMAPRHSSQYKTKRKISQPMERRYRTW